MNSLETMKSLETMLVETVSLENISPETFLFSWVTQRFGPF
jgi:hypothetical protein